jgi:hypothetical protein
MEGYRMTRLGQRIALLAASFGFVLFAAETGLPTSAAAQGRADRCQDYAREAVRQADDNVRNNCGYNGPRWNSDRNAHFGWCMLFPRQANDENQARADDLRRCTADRGGGGGGDRNRQGKRANCDTYSSIAAVQADANDKYKCGNRGGEWNNSKRAHFEWCMTNKREFMLDEMRYRAQELQKCFNNLGDYDDDRWDRNYQRRF